MGLRRHLRPSALSGLRIELLIVSRFVFATGLRLLLAAVCAGFLLVFLRLFVLLDRLCCSRQLLLSRDLFRAELRLWGVRPSGRSIFLWAMWRSLVCFGNFARRMPQRWLLTGDDIGTRFATDNQRQVRLEFDEEA